MARSADTYRAARRNAYRSRHVLPVWRIEPYVGGLGQTLSHPLLGRANANTDATGDLRWAA